jgi:hypothetical protein
MIQDFAIAARIPRKFYEDKEFYPHGLHSIFEYELEKAGATRIAGPLAAREIEFGYWDIDDDGRWVTQSKESRWWSLAIIRVVGPAVPGGENAG